MPARPRYRNRRKRRLRRMTLLLSAVAVAATLAGVLAWRASRPEVRRPGEALDDITAGLARDLPAEAPAPRFTDVTAEAGLAEFSTFSGDRSSQLPEDMGAGAAWGDFDNDGDDDLLLVAAGGALTEPRERWRPTRLYENLGDGRFRPVAGFPEPRIAGMAAAWGDYDGDGWLDLAVSGYRSLTLYANRRGRFEPVELAAREVADEGFWTGLSWADFDNDRDLDLYVCGYVRYVEDAGSGRRVSDQYGTAVPYTLNPASFEPERNLLLENLGGGRFREVAQLWGVSNPEGRSLSALWHDFDQDGRLDLYVANDISDNALYMNRGDTFEEVGLAAWVADYRGAMGLAAGDWNRDGDDDLFITHWIAQENALYDSRLLDTARAAAASGAPAPTQITFSDQAAPLGLGQPALHAVGWGTEFVDFDRDGWLDLAVSNGSTLETGDPPRRLKPQPMMLFWSRQGQHFHDLAPLAPALAEPVVGRGLAAADYDGDGDLDLVQVVLGGGARLLRNDLDGGGWLGVRLRARIASGEPHGFGDGSTVIARLGEVELRRTLSGGSYLSQSSRTLHFGLGAAEAVDELEVRWLGGEPQRFGRLEAGAVWQLTEGEAEPLRLSPAGAAAATDERGRVVEFWTTQRAAMDAFKRDADCDAAVPLFRRALELDPRHEDSRYYLANCLAEQGRPEAALAELDQLRRQSPMSHRAHKQWGVLRAIHASSDDQLGAAQAALERSHEINLEETGSLLVLGEIALLRGRPEEAERLLELACRSNPRAVGGFFLRGYVAWRRGDAAGARRLLAAAAEARGPDWKPEGTTAEGDTAKSGHREESPLAGFWERWDGGSEPSAAFAALAERLG